MTSISFVTPSILKVGIGTVAATILGLAIRGSIISQGQFICDSVKNPNCGIVYGVQGYDIPAYAKDTNTGGLATYDLIRVGSPYDATAPSRGLKTGTGVVTYAQLNIIANPKGVSVDCSEVGAKNSATGGTLLFNNITATGSTNIYATPFVIGPTQFVKCGTLQNPASTFSGTLLLKTTYSEVIN